MLLPGWLLVGLADWWCHRVSRIEDTAGPPESALHLLLSAEAGLGILPALLFEIDALILAVIVFAFVAHEITTNIDIRLAFAVRRFSRAEQRIHDALTAVPFAALCLVIATHAGQTLALFGFGDQVADFGLHWKTPPLPRAYIFGWLVLSALLNVAPYTEELWRTLRRAQRRSS